MITIQYFALKGLRHHMIWNLHSKTTNNKILLFTKDRSYQYFFDTHNLFLFLLCSFLRFGCTRGSKCTPLGRVPMKERLKKSRRHTYIYKVTLFLEQRRQFHENSETTFKLVFFPHEIKKRTRTQEIVWRR
jgi:hypothetical protein